MLWSRLTFCSIAIALMAVGAAEAKSPATQRDESAQRAPYVVAFGGSFLRSDLSVQHETLELQAQLGFQSDHRYRHALKGFSARLTDRQAANLRRNPLVAMVEPDTLVRVAGRVSPAAGESIPSGISRIGAGSVAQGVHQASTTAVAVLDTGIDLDGDVEAEPGVNCSGARIGLPEDDNGHGTMVAGIIGARNDGSGIVGVAPGTRLYAVKVFGQDKTGPLSDVICGVDWVTGHAGELGIKVATMSFAAVGISTACGDDVLHLAICHSTQAGVTYVVAAGNAGRNVASTMAAFPEVLTVTAMSDSDGQPGGIGGGPPCASLEADDFYATFSNYATREIDAAHMIAAPGVCIRSLKPGGGFRTLSGTSAATPHVAGVVALCMGEGGAPGPCADMTTSEVIQQIRADAAANATLENGFIGDPLHPLGAYYGYLVSGIDPSIRRIPVRQAVAATPPPSVQAVDVPLVDTQVDLQRLRVRSLGKQAIRIIIRLGEPVTVKASGSVFLRKKKRRATDSRKLVFKSSNRPVVAGRDARVRLKLSRRTRRIVLRSLRRGRKAQARVTVRVEDGAGNKLVKRRRVGVRR
jgi:subtilisin